MNDMELDTAFYDALNYMEKEASLKKSAKKKEGGKYDHIDFKPPAGVAAAAKKGLEFRKRNGGKGGLSNQQASKEGIGSGVQRATNLMNRDEVSPKVARQMKAFFSRHEKNKGVAKGKQPHEDRGHVAWLLWGGDAGKAWAEKLCKQMDSADEKSKKK